MHFVLLLFVFCLCLLALSDDVLGVDFFVFILFEFKLRSVDNFFSYSWKMSDHCFFQYFSALHLSPLWVSFYMEFAMLGESHKTPFWFCFFTFFLFFRLCNPFRFIFRLFFFFFAKSNTMLGVSSECFISFFFQM